ncbi:hypothetical protein BX666DRAFT_1979734, partial [Dichotomocladium elegans]
MVLCCFWAGELGASVILQGNINQITCIKCLSAHFPSSFEKLEENQKHGFIFKRMELVITLAHTRN